MSRLDGGPLVIPAETRLGVVRSAETSGCPATSAIELLGVSKVYTSLGGKSVPALHDVTFSVAPGEFVSIIGPSGCGKSTLLKLISGLAPRSDGEIRVNGRVTSGPQREIGMVFQNPVLLPWLTVLDNALLSVRFLRLSRAGYEPRARAILDMVGLAGFEQSYPFELSGGMQQRAAIARSLVHDPAVLLMDEPFGALDAFTREQMMLELQAICERSRKTVLFVTHSIAEAIFLSDRVVVVSARPGRVLDVFSVDFPRPRTLQMMGTREFADLVADIRQRIMDEGQGIDFPRVAAG